MNDDVLSRARKLAEAANIVAAQMSQQAADFMSVSALRSKQIEEEQFLQKIEIENKLASNKAPSRNEIGNSRMFKGAVIHGSSLVTTYNDIRSCAHRYIYSYDFNCSVLNNMLSFISIIVVFFI